MTKRDGIRVELIAKHKQWLWALLQEPASPQLRELSHLLARPAAWKLELLCWCNPLTYQAELMGGGDLVDVGRGRG
jgi:hypothetical protein